MGSHSTSFVPFQRIDNAMESLKNFSCGLCAVGFDTQAQLKRHKQQAEHVSMINICLNISLQVRRVGILCYGVHFGRGPAIRIYV